MPLSRRILLAAAVVATVAFVHSARAADRKAPDDVEFTADVVYGKAGGRELKLDLSRPKKAAAKDGKTEHGLPCVLVIHGGGWAQGNKEAHDDITWVFAQHGYVAATVGYRLAPNFVFPAQVQDVKCAVRFLRAHAADYGLDPDRIGAVGFSAGGHLSMMLATTRKEDGLEGDGGSADQSSKVQAAVAFFGPTDLLAPDLPTVTDNILKNFIGGTKAEKTDAYKAASPITYVRADSAPMLLLQGTKDPLVPHTQATLMADAMTKAGVPGRVELLLGQSHGWGGTDLKRTGDETLAFFDEHLKKEQAPAPQPPAKKEAVESKPK